MLGIVLTVLGALVVGGTTGVFIFLKDNRQKLLRAKFLSVTIVLAASIPSYLLFSSLHLKPLQDEMLAERQQLMIAEGVIVPPRANILGMTDEMLIREAECLVTKLERTYAEHESRRAEIERDFGGDPDKRPESEQRRYAYLAAKEKRETLARFDDRLRSDAALIVGEIVTRLPLETRIEMHSGPVIAVSIATILVRPDNPRTNDRYVSLSGAHSNPFNDLMGPQAIDMVADDIRALVEKLREAGQ